jgi:ubiquinone/menaquinone biosynthesis C-methylase UbiE
MLAADEIKTAVSRYGSGRTAGFDLAPSHHVLTVAQHQAWLDLLQEVAGPPPLTVLDVGYGMGFLAMRMAEWGYTAFGSDLAEEILAVSDSKYLKKEGGSVWESLSPHFLYPSNDAVNPHISWPSSRPLV